MSNEREEIQETGGKYKWLKKLGLAGFLFFFLKGMVWLVIIFMAGKCAVS